MNRTKIMKQKLKLKLLSRSIL